MMKDYHICLSIEEMDPDFARMKHALEKIANVTVVGLSGYSLAGFDIFIGKKMSREILATADQLQLIFAYKTGVDDFPLDEIAKRGIQVINSHADSDFIAQYAFGLGISLTSRIPEFDKKFRRGIWYDHENPYWKSIFEMKIGLAGYGHIGQAIHKILYNNRIDTYTINRGKKYAHIKTVPDLTTLCDTCDMLILSLPKIPATDCIIDREMLTHLKNKYLVNVGRGNCIDLRALFDALNNKELAGAAIDTWNQKPAKDEVDFFPFEVPLHTLDNIVLSPHQAMKVSRGHEQYVTDITKKVISYILTGELSDIVDLQKGY